MSVSPQARRRRWDAARQALARAAASWRGLDPADPALWPALPRHTLYAATALAVAVPAWLLSSAQAEAGLRAAQGREAELKQAFTAKLAQAAQVAPLQRRRQELRERVAEQEAQAAPARAEALLEALHQAALRRGLQVDLIRPEPAPPRASMAELAVTLRLAGRYGALGGFAADVAALEPPVALHDLQLVAGAGGAGHVLEATVRGLARPEDARKAADTAPGASMPAGKAEARP